MHIKEAGYDVLDTPDRTGECGICNGIQFIQVNRRMVPRFVASGYVDAGITGQDIYVNSGLQLNEYCELPFAKQSDRPSRWVLAALPDFEMGRSVLNSRQISEQRIGPVTIGCELTKLAQKVLGSRRPPLPFDFEIVFIDGSEELAVVAGITDLALAVTETGNSIKANGLVILPGCDKLFESVPAIYTLNGLEPSKAVALEELALSMQSVIGASAFVEVEWHFHDEMDIEALGLPADLSPTISDLSISKWHEGKVVVPRKLYPQVVRLLKRAGATDIVRKTIQGHL